MMFRFSCFNTHIHSHKQKKTVHLSSEAMHRILEDCSPNQSPKNSNYSRETTSPDLSLEGDAVKNLPHCATDSSFGCDCKSEDMEKNAIDCDISLSTVHRMKKSQSLGSGLDRKGRNSGDNASEDEIDQLFSCDGSHGQNGAKDSGTSTPHQFQGALSSDACQINADVVNHEFMCSGDVQQSEKEGHENSGSHISGPGESADCIPCSHPAIVKSNSLPNISSPGRLYPLPHSRSAEDLIVLDSRQKQMLIHDVKTQELQHQERNYEGWNSNDKNNCENPVDESYDTYDCVGSSKDWIVPVADEVNGKGNLRRYSSSCQWDDLPGKDFKIKRIEEWVLDLQHCSPLEESNECMSEGHDSPKSSNVLDIAPASRVESKVNKPSMEAVKKYISSLSATSTAAQLVSHGLVVIPFFSAFSSLRALNLSGNAIVRITAGALPRGLHVLNLSKNSISTIEGLRELTRLRVLDLSYNRLLRIGHGLASCSSLKELYLAGNKISEVEGLHRLLKLNVLDLRFNKISTTKCLGQLAANYVSLQAISLEGNPAQKNVGDEQLKKYLQGLLPHLTYFNRQPIKTGTLKDTTERSARLGMSAHQIDRGLKPELKAMRKATHSTTSQKLPPSSNHGRRSQVTTTSKPSKGRHTRLPPNGAKVAATQQNQLYDFNSKLLSFRSEFSMRRSRSEGTLGVL